MTPQEIKDNAPDGANGYIVMKNNKVRYFDTKTCRAYIDGMWYFASFSVLHRIKPLN